MSNYLTITCEIISHLYVEYLRLKDYLFGTSVGTDIFFVN
mgnify:CR=1 FL=1